MCEKEGGGGRRAMEAHWPEGDWRSPGLDPSGGVMGDVVRAALKTSLHVSSLIHYLFIFFPCRNQTLVIVLRMLKEERAELFILSVMQF